MEPASVTRRQRHWRRAVSMLGACLATTTAGTVYLFSTYGPGLSKRLHLTSTQSNVVAISANYGLLLSGPFFGWAADTVGPRILSAFAAAGSFTAFSALAYTYNGTLPLPSWLVLSAYMVLVGISCQAVNMSAITVTTRNFKENRGAAVSLCIAFFGLSPFVLSHVNSIFFSRGDDGPNIFGYLRFLSLLGLVTSTAATLSLSVVGFGPSRYRRDIPDGFIADYDSSIGDGSSSGSYRNNDEQTHAGVDEESGLLRATETDGGTDASPSYSAVVKASIGASETDNNGDTAAASGTGSGPGSLRAVSGISQAEIDNGSSQLRSAPRGNANGVDYDTARDLGGMDYVRDPEAQLLALVLFLCAGIGVFYNNNVGTIVSAIYYSSTKDPDASAAQRLINHHVSAVSLGSFVGRLSIGVLADFCKRAWGLPRSGILVVVVFGTVLSQVVVGSAETLPALLVGSAMTGLSYGLIFGFVPLLVSVWFGTKHFGSNWGLTSVFIGFSGQALGAYFGYVYDSNLPDQDPSKCVRGSCYKDAFVLSVGLGLLGLLASVVLARRRGDRRRENRRLWEEQEYSHIPYVPFILAE
ncbi:hypothetical protein GGI15_000648 [Coemansia interrupta]|uniref:Major facilitator superfamily (MFS) profile domain-containing protein n=1 Tax=Coemansia interrupta TaxID=1126814 RepID=A0A9W8HLB2_9FUNG|nr:hypothetical protein GGI15_000648 [Coemansia interrupta]